jgi:hypothetical protein
MPRHPPHTNQPVSLLATILCARKSKKVLSRSKFSSLSNILLLRKPWRGWPSEPWPTTALTPDPLAIKAHRTTPTIIFDHCQARGDFWGLCFCNIRRVHYRRCGWGLVRHTVGRMTAASALLNATIHAIIILADGIDSTCLWHCWYVPLLELGRLTWAFCHVDSSNDRWSRHRRRFILLTEHTTQQTPRRQILNGCCRSHWSASQISQFPRAISLTHGAWHNNSRDDNVDKGSIESYNKTPFRNLRGWWGASTFTASSSQYNLTCNFHVWLSPILTLSTSLLLLLLLWEYDRQLVEWRVKKSSNYQLRR